MHAIMNGGREMSTSGTRISSLRVTYQEQYQDPSWPSNSTATHRSIESSGNLPLLSTLPVQSCTSVESNHDTATVPRDETLRDVCDGLEPDSLFSHGNSLAHKPATSSVIGRTEEGGSAVPPSQEQILYMSSSGNACSHQGNPTNHYGNGLNCYANSVNHYSNGLNHHGNPINHYGNGLNHQGNLFTDGNPPSRSSYPNSYSVPIAEHSLDNHTGTGYPQNGVVPSDTAVLYGLEDKLRHKINVHIENFRADIQDEFYEQFGLYRQSLRPQHTSQWDRCTPGCVTRKPQPDTIASQEAIGDGSCCSIYSNSESSSTVCSGVGGPPQTTGCDQRVNQTEEDEMNLCLIKLQTYSAAISSTLRRTEYAVT